MPQVWRIFAKDSVAGSIEEAVVEAVAEAAGCGGWSAAGHAERGTGRSAVARPEGPDRGSRAADPGGTRHGTCPGPARRLTRSPAGAGHRHREVGVGHGGLWSPWRT